MRGKKAGTKTPEYLFENIGGISRNKPGKTIQIRQIELPFRKILCGNLWREYRTFQFHLSLR